MPSRAFTDDHVVGVTCSSGGWHACHALRVIGTCSVAGTTAACGDMQSLRRSKGRVFLCLGHT
jgi:hypothetical protein